MRKAISYVTVAGMLFFLFAVAGALPQLYDPNSPAARHVSPRYIEKSHEEIGSANYVTAVLADYRGYDTLGETTVIFTAGVVTVMLLRTGLKRKKL